MSTLTPQETSHPRGRTERLSKLYDAGTLALQLDQVSVALDLLSMVAQRAQDPILGSQAWANMGVGLRRQGRQEEARSAFLQALERDPESISARFNLANTLAALGRHEEALGHYTQLRATAPERADVATNMGALLMAMGRAPEAAVCFAEAVRLNPHDACAWGNLGAAQVVVGQAVAPLRSLQQALRLDPRNARTHIKIGCLLTEQGHLDAAKMAFSSAQRLAPGHLDVAAGLAQVLHRRGEDQEALTLLAPLVQAGKLSPNLVATWAQICRRTGRQQAAIGPLQAQIDAAVDPATLSLLHHCLGDVLDPLGRTAEAFAAHAHANQLRGLSHDPDAHSAWVDRIISHPLHPQGGSCTSEVPVLIVGMPRSGTSLVEQILASHASVHGAGELDELRQVSIMASRATSTPYPEALAQLQPGQLDRIADAYLGRLCRGGPEASRVTDKMPQNFLYLGLAAAMLPYARVIHCVRDPADTGLSCYFQNFKDTLGFTTDLEWLARWIQDYQRLMDHWKRVLPLPILDVPYAELCRDPETWSRRIVAFSDLDWDPRCLMAHTHSRVVRTASYAQVRTPIYQTSIGRADTYAAHIPGLLALRLPESSPASSTKPNHHPMNHQTDG